MTDLKADVEALKILRAEDARRAQEALDEMEAKLEKAEASVATLTGAVTKLSQTQQKPWFKQAPFWAGILTLPTLLFAGKLFAVYDHPEIIGLMHRLLGTNEAVAVALKTDDSKLSRAVDGRILAQGDEDSALTEKLGETFVRNENVEEVVRTVVLRAIEDSFRTVHISSLRLGLAGYEPELFQGAKAIQMDPVKVEDRLFSVPPKKTVDIIIGAFAQRFDSAHIARHSAPRLQTQLTPEEQDDLRNRVRIRHHYTMADLPEISFNDKRLTLEPVRVAGFPTVGDDGTLQTDAPYVFKVKGVETGDIDETIRTATMSLTAKTREGDLDNAWYLNVVVNLSSDDGA